MKTCLLLALLLVFLLETAVGANFVCKGSVNKPKVITSDVVVRNGVNCVLNGIMVTGSVHVGGKGSLRTAGTVKIFGSISATNAGQIKLQGKVTVLGVVSVTKSNGAVTVGKQAKLGSLMLSQAGNVLINGRVSEFRAKSSKAVTLKGATIAPGGLNVEFGNGKIEVCGSTLSGGIQLLQTKGDLKVVAGGNCAKSVIGGSVKVLKGKGAARLVNARIDSGDLNVVEQAGAVQVVGGTVSDVLVEKVKGNIELRNIKTDSDTSISKNIGNIKLAQSTIQGDLLISQNKGAVNVLGNDLRLEVATITRNSGPVNIKKNKNASFNIVENRAVQFVGNNGRSVSISKNTKGVKITGNKLEKLTCSDNRPPPTGSGNNISGLADGQCRKLK